MSLQEKSEEEISHLLNEYGIKHGPIVGSTRKLYEKKLEEAMETAVTPSSDKTYYREEEEEITYITYQRPVSNLAYKDMLKRRNNTKQDEDEESDQNPDLPIQVTNRTANQSAVQRREPVRKSGGCMWRAMQLLLLSAVLAAAFYYIYCRVINNEQDPFGIQ